MLVRAVALSLTGLAGAMRLPRTQVPRVANVAARGLRVSRPALMVEEGTQAKGTCAWFDTTKGFGFINIDGEDGPDIFVHQTDIYARGFRSLAEGEPVEFMVSKDARSGKLKAIEVRRARDAPPCPGHAVRAGAERKCACAGDRARRQLRTGRAARATVQ